MSADAGTGGSGAAGGRLLMGAGAGAAPAGDGGAAPSPKKSKKKLIILAVVVLVVAGGAFYFLKLSKHPPVRYKPGQAVPAGKVVSLGTFTVNTSDGHIVQVGVDLQLTKPAVTKTVTTDHAKLDNATIADVDNFTYGELLTPAGRSGLRQQLVASYEQILGPVDGAAPQVTAVYFTSFVAQ